MENIMKQYEKQVNVFEGPWSTKAFPNGEETTEGVISRKMITLYEKDGYLCEEEVTREYRVMITSTLQQIREY